MTNPIPSPRARPSEYVAGLVAVVLLVLNDAGVAIPDPLLVSLPVLAAWIVTGIAAALDNPSAPQEVDANPDD